MTLHTEVCLLACVCPWGPDLVSIWSFLMKSNFKNFFLADHFHHSCSQSCFLKKIFRFDHWVERKCVSKSKKGTSKLGEISDFLVCQRKF